MVELIIKLLMTYLAMVIVFYLHEIGHRPTKIKFKFGVVPSAVAYGAKWREGGLVVNVVIFFVVFYLQPGSLFFQLIGLVAWLHFINYMILGSLLPEPKEGQVNLKTFVFDDVNNKYAVPAIAIAVFSYLYFQSYYIPILEAMFA